MNVLLLLLSLLTSAIAGDDPVLVVHTALKSQVRAAEAYQRSGNHEDLIRILAIATGEAESFVHLMCRDGCSQRRCQEAITALAQAKRHLYSLRFDQAVDSFKCLVEIEPRICSVPSRHRTGANWEHIQDWFEDQPGAHSCPEIRTTQTIRKRGRSLSARIKAPADDSVVTLKNLRHCNYTVGLLVNGKPPTIVSIVFHNNFQPVLATLVTSGSVELIGFEQGEVVTVLLADGSDIVARKRVVITGGRTTIRF